MQNEDFFLPKENKLRNKHMNVWFKPASSLFQPFGIVLSFYYLKPKWFFFLLNWWSEKTPYSTQQNFPVKTSEIVASLEWGLSPWDWAEIGFLSHGWGWGSPWGCWAGPVGLINALRAFINKYGLSFDGQQASFHSCVRWLQHNPRSRTLWVFTSEQTTFFFTCFRFSVSWQNIYSLYCSCLQIKC